jgi:hypothetical protein
VRRSVFDRGAGEYDNEKRQNEGGADADRIKDNGGRPEITA